MVTKNKPEMVETGVFCRVATFFVMATFALCLGGCHDDQSPIKPRYREAEYPPRDPGGEDGEKLIPAIDSLKTNGIGKLHFKKNTKQP